MELLIYIRDNISILKGTVIEIQPDGHFGEPTDYSKHGYNHDVYRLIRIPGEAIDLSLSEGDQINPISKYITDATVAVKGPAILSTRQSLKLPVKEKVIL